MSDGRGVKANRCRRQRVCIVSRHSGQSRVRATRNYSTFTEVPMVRSEMVKSFNSTFTKIADTLKTSSDKAKSGLRMLMNPHRQSPVQRGPPKQSFKRQSKVCGQVYRKHLLLNRNRNLNPNQNNSNSGDLLRDPHRKDQTQTHLLILSVGKFANIIPSIL